MDIGQENALVEEDEEGEEENDDNNNTKEEDEEQISEDLLSLRHSFWGDINNQVTIIYRVYSRFLLCSLLSIIILPLFVSLSDHVIIISIFFCHPLVNIYIHIHTNRENI